jgi:hypothetical protein
MTPDERTLLQRFLADLDASRGAAKDPEADQMIAQAMGSNPDAAYLLVQHALLADQALQVARQHLDELQRQQPQAPAQAPVSFLGGAAGQAQGYPQQGYGAQAYPGAGPLSPNGGLGGFLRTAGTMAAGVAGGEFLMQGLSNLFAPRDW